MRMGDLEGEKRIVFSSCTSSPKNPQTDRNDVREKERFTEQKLALFTGCTVDWVLFGKEES